MSRMRLLTIAALILLLGACSSGSSTESLTVEVDESSGEIAISTDADPTTTTILVGGTDGTDGAEAPAPSIETESELPDGVGSDGVLVAAVVLATGDIEAALDAGLVTPAEVEAAVQALQDGSLPDIVG